MHYLSSGCGAVWEIDMKDKGWYDITENYKRAKSYKWYECNLKAYFSGRNIINGSRKYRFKITR